MSVKHDIIKMIFLVRCDTIKILTNPKIMLEQANHEFTVSVAVLILPTFRQLLLRNGKISSKCLF